MILRYMLALVLTLVNMCAPAYASTKRIVSADIVEGQVSGQNLLPGASTHFEKNVGKWLSFADPALSVPDNLTGGSANTTCTRSGTSPLDGEGSMLMTVNSGASRQGEGCALEFNINVKDKYKMLQGKFEYAISSGTYADDEVSVWIYDVTNAKIIQPNESYVKNHSLPSETHTFSFQSTDSLNYRVGIYVRGTSSAGYVLKMDNYHIANGSDIGKNHGAFASGVQSWTPTGSWSTNTTYTGTWYRVADIGYYEVKVALSGAPTAATLTVNLPPGHTIDTAKLADGAIRAPAGTAEIQDFGVSSYPARVQLYNTTSVVLALLSRPTTYVEDPTFVSNTLPMSFGNQDYITLKFSAPIVGWSSSQILSSDANTRVFVEKIYRGSFSTSAGGFVYPNTSWTIGNSTHGKAQSDGKIYIPFTGYFRINAFLDTGTAVGNVLVSYRINGSGDTFFSGKGTSDRSSHTSMPLLLSAGSYIEVGVYNSAVETISFMAWSLDQCLGPSQIAASETVAARYTTAAGQSIPNSSTTIIDFGTKDFDYTSSTTTGASWKFTAPISGLYEVSGHLMFTTGGGWASGEAANAALYKGGVAYMQLSVQTSDATHSNYVPLTLAAASIRLLAGEYVDVRVFQDSGASLALINNALFNWISIKRVGNY